VTTTSERSATKRALLDQRLRGFAADGTPRIPRRPAGVASPLSFAQERVWFMEQYAPGTAAYAIPIVIRLRGPLNRTALQAALDAVVARHETLRMTFPSTVDGRPEVRIAASLTIPIQPVHGDEGEVRDAFRVAAVRPFDLERGPLLRALLASLGENEHLLVLAGHHLIGDGWSHEVLLRDLMAFYRAARVPDLSVQYGDYARWQRDRLAGGGLDRHREYWTAALAGLPALELPTDRPRPSVRRFEGAAHRFTLDAELSAALAGLGRAHGATPFMTLLAAYQVLLGRLAGQDDFAVGSPVAGRTRPELENLVGMFVNMLVFRARLGDDPGFGEFLARTRREVLDGLTHQEMPFEQIVSELGVTRDVRRSPLFQVTFAVHNFAATDRPATDRPAAGSGGLAADWDVLQVPATRFDLELQVVETGAELSCLFVYDTALFDPATVARLAGMFRTLLRSIVAEPDVPVSRLRLLDEVEWTLVARRWSDGAPVPLDGATLPELVEAQVQRTPDAIAVIDTAPSTELSYRTLNACANRVAHRLRAAGAGPETLVAVCAERSADLVVALLGVLKAGAAYVPLDPEYPAERLAFMLGDSAAPIVLAQRRTAQILPAAPVEVLLLDDPEAWADQPSHDPAPRATAANPAYMIYTSGSTGRPKGAVTTHGAIRNRIDWMQREYRLGVADAVLQKTPAGFDVSVWEFFWPLVTGARLVLARPGGHKDPAYLRDIVVSAAVTTLHFVPSMLAAFLAEDGLAGCRSLRRIVCSGEELPPHLVALAGARLPWCTLDNLYGPTEAAVDVSSWRCDPGGTAPEPTVPIGRPLQNVRLYVLDRWLAPVAPGTTAELFIGGIAVARGYWRRPALTAERFVPDPFGPPGSRLYRTGDLARWSPAGALEFLGRGDTQVKLRGQRIELGEIEARLGEQPAVRECAVVVQERSADDKRLVAFLVADSDLDLAEIRSALKQTLPDFMVPSAVVALDAMPLTPNGKLDRTALAALPPSTGNGERGARRAPRSGTETVIADVWAEVLGLAEVGIDDDFFELGGHSMLAMRVVAKLRTALGGVGRPVGVLDLFTERTVAGLAALVARPAADGTRRLLYELTAPVPAAGRVRSFVCLPYGGGSAVVYQPLADALPPGNSLYSVAIPGHDVGLDEEALPFDELARRTTEEILDTVPGPIVLYGHCGVGSALVVEVARRLEAAGRELEAVYVGAIFPFARTDGVVGRLLAWLDRRSSDRLYANWLKSRGVDMEELDPAQAERIVRNTRADGRRAEAYFGALLDSEIERLRAPVISVIGERDPATDFYPERYREWQFLTDTTAVVVLDEAGHYFLKYRAAELAEIVTRTHPAVAAGATEPDAIGPLLAAERPGAGWWLHDVDRVGAAAPDTTKGAEPSMRRFASVAAGQLVSMTGSALTAWAIPVWIYLQTGSLAKFSLFAVSGLVPSLLIGPLAGAVVDRSDRRRVMMAAGAVAGGCQLVLGVLHWTGTLQPWHLYAGVAGVASALVFQRLAFTSAIPQLVPKRFLGNANGVAQLSSGFAMLLVPLVAAGLLAAVGLGNIFLLDVLSYALAIGVLAAVRFPNRLGRTRREPLIAEIAGGWRYSWGNRALRALLLFSAMINTFLGPALILVSPLVLSFGSLTDVGLVSFAEAAGAFVGGLVFTFWGGPARRRMFGLLVATLGLAACCLVTGLRPQVAVVAAGVFGTGLTLAVIQSTYATIVQVKIPQRFHGRVFALNQMIAWSTLPLGFAVIAPLATSAFRPLLQPGGALAGTVGRVVGVGAERGIGLVYAVVAVAIAALTLLAMRRTILARFDADVPDAVPDDLVGLQALQERTPV